MAQNYSSPQPFTGIVTQPVTGAPGYGLDGEQMALDMLPLMSGDPSGRTTEEILDIRLGLLQTLSTIHIDMSEDDLRLLDETDKLVLLCDRQSTHSRGDVAGSRTEFIFPGGGQILFTSNRESFGTRVVSGDIALGKVEGDMCGCDRSFTVRSSPGVTTDYPKLKLKPTGCAGTIGCSCFNACCIYEYIIYADGVQIGKINCWKGKPMVTFPANSSVRTKANLISALIIIYELYFSPCFGNVGEIGSRYIFACGWLLGSIFVTVIIVLVKLIQQASKEIPPD